MDDLIIIDNFLDHSVLNATLQQLEEQGLSAFQEYQLPALVNRATGRTAAVLVPGPVVLAVKAALGAGAEAVDDVVTLPALMSRGDVRSHRDVWNSKPSAFVKSHTVMIWLQEGNSQLILESTDQQHVVDAIAGRLVAFNNRCFRHEVHGSSEVRAMLGPMALDATGKFAAVMDPIDFTSSNRGCWANCLCCCFLCCAGSCFLLVNTIGSFCFTLLLIFRAIFGAVRGALAASILAPLCALCYAGTAFWWSPAILIRACKGLQGDRKCTSLMTILLLPLRTPLVLLFSLALIFTGTFLWIFFATVVYEEEGEECKNLLVGGLITVGPFSGVLEVLPKMILDWWRYHASWSPDLSILQRLESVEPQRLGAEAWEAAPELPGAFLDRSETWQYVAGSISTKDVWKISLRRTTMLGAELHSKGYITEDDIHALEPFLFVGLPASAVVRLVLRSSDSDGLDFEEMKVTAANRPHNAFADSIWSIAMKAKREAERAKPISEVEKDYLLVAALQRPESDLKWDIEETRRAELHKIVAAAVDLSLTASRSPDFKNSIGSVIQGILDIPQAVP